MILSVCFSVKVTNFKMFFPDYKKVDYDTNCFSLTPHVLSARIKRKMQLSAMIGTNWFFGRFRHRN